MSKLFLKSKGFLIYFGLIFLLVFVQFLFLNIIPGKANEIDFFLIVSSFFVLKKDFRLSFLFIFFSVFVDEVVFPIAKITGLKTMSALITGYLFYLIFRKMVLKDFSLCLVIVFYCNIVYLLTKVFLFLLGYSYLSFNIEDYLWLSFNTLLVSCLIDKRLNVQ